MTPMQRRSEAVEREALASLHRYCPEDTREAIGLFCDEIRGALICGALKDPSRRFEDG